MIYDFELPDDMKKNSEFYYYFLAFDKKIKANYDGRTKHIGDRVIIWDSSCSCDIKGNTYFESEDFFKNELIVVSTDIKYNKTVMFQGNTYTLDLDLILYSPSTKKKVRSNSECCRILD